MDKYSYQTCNCSKGKSKDYDRLDFKQDPCTCYHCHECCCTCEHNLCRKDLCATDFNIRLNGLQRSLNYCIHQLLWSTVVIELENGEKLEGTISFVGFNFVELIVDKTFLLKMEDGVEEAYEEKVEGDSSHEIEKRCHEKGRTQIFSINKIKAVELICSCRD